MWSKTLLLKNNFHSQHDTKLFNECYLSYHLYLLDGHLKDTTLYKKKNITVLLRFMESSVQIQQHCIVGLLLMVAIISQKIHISQLYQTSVENILQNGETFNQTA